MHRPRPLTTTLLPLVAGLLLAFPVRASAPAPGEHETASEDAREEDTSPEPSAEVYRPITSGPFVTFTAPITAPGRLVTQPILYLATARGDYDVEGRYQPRARGESLRTAALSLFVEYGIVDRLAAGAQLVLQYNRRRSGPDLASFTGLGDTTFFGRGTILEETAGGLLPEMTLLAQVKLPTARAVSAQTNLLDTDVLGTGSTDLTVGLDLTKGVRPVLLHADVLYTYALPARIGGERVAYGPSLAWSLSGEWPFWRDRLGLMLEVSGRHQGAPVRDGREEEDGLADEVLVGAGLELLFSADVQLLVGYQRTLWGRNARALDALVITLVPTVL
ncbi:hypothetical protein [Archangium sp.]|uniref:hypothetical protein n=1 Tax=Archangium sp. TaxID=1872627 RepID=UPI00286D46CB|nr:hypothetical protein [Archangium sp.]